MPSTPARRVKPIVLFDAEGKRIYLGGYTDGRIVIGREGKAEEKKEPSRSRGLVLTGRSGRKIGFGVWPDGSLVVGLGPYPGEERSAQKAPRDASPPAAPAEWDESVEPATIIPLPVTRRPPRSATPTPPAIPRQAPQGSAKPLSPRTLELVRKVRRGTR